MFVVGCITMLVGMLISNNAINALFSKQHEGRGTEPCPPQVGRIGVKFEKEKKYSQIFVLIKVLTSGNCLLPKIWELAQLQVLEF